jgi:hypothetical protein
MRVQHANKTLPLVYTMIRFYPNMTILTQFIRPTMLKDKWDKKGGAERADGEVDRIMAA